VHYADASSALRALVQRKQMSLMIT